MNSIPLKMFFVLISLPIALAARAGDWSSGGGALLKTAENPWFLKNATSVTYCIEADEKVFGNMPTALPVIVRKAIQYWKGEFEKERKSIPGTLHHLVEIGTQEFRYLPGQCKPEADIRFFFGLVPRDSQIPAAELKRFIGLAHRTQYDERILRGRGFVYIAADSGPMSYEQDGLPASAWHRGAGGRLYQVLIHELGHVFGMPHIPGVTVMDERYPEEIVRYGDSQQDQLSFYASSLVPDSMLEYAFYCSNQWSPVFLKYFGVEAPGSAGHSACENYRFRVDTPYQSPNHPPFPVKIIGELRVTGSMYESLGGVRLWLPKDQQVFQGEPFKPYMTLEGPMAFVAKWKGEFIPTNSGVSRPILIQRRPGTLARTVTGGVLDGQFYFDLFNGY